MNWFLNDQPLTIGILDTLWSAQLWFEQCKTTPISKGVLHPLSLTPCPLQLSRKVSSSYLCYSACFQVSLREQTALIPFLRVVLCSHIQLVSWTACWQSSRLTSAGLSVPDSCYVWVDSWNIHFDYTLTPGRPTMSIWLFWIFELNLIFFMLYRFFFFSFWLPRTSILRDKEFEIFASMQGEWHDACFFFFTLFHQAVKGPFWQLGSRWCYMSQSTKEFTEASRCSFWLPEGSCDSGGTADLPLFTALIVRSPHPPVHMSKRPWTRHWPPNCCWWLASTLRGSLLLPLVCECERNWVNEWQKPCKVLWIKALYKCSHLSKLFLLSFSLHFLEML